MKTRSRPQQIDSILSALNPQEVSTTELETYIADLEAKQPDRPTRITLLLQEMESRCSPEALVSLDAYITQLEANQRLEAPPEQGPRLQFDPENPPHWSHQRAVEREQRRQARALKRQMGYQ